MYKNYILCTFLAALLLLSTAGCGSDNAETDGETGETTPARKRSPKPNRSGSRALRKRITAARAFTSYP